MFVVPLAVVLSAGSAGAEPIHMRVIAVVDGVTLFDRTVAALLDTDAGLNVVMAAQDAAREAGASELDIINGMTTLPSSVEIAVTTTRHSQDGSNVSDVTQSGSAHAGDAIGGQVVSVVTAGGSATVTKTNVSENVRTSTGDSTGRNTSHGE